MITAVIALKPSVALSIANHITDLIAKGRTSLIKGFRNKDGKAFDAHVAFDKDFRTVYEFPPRTDKSKGKGGRR